jgi:hypothetical protein
MNLKKISTSLLTLTTVAALPVSTSAQAVNQTKISQCNQIIAIANLAIKDTNALTNTEQASSPREMLKAAEAMESAARQLESLSITDQRLQSYRLRYVNIYRQTGSATRDFLTAYERRDPDEARTAIQALQIATSPEKQLVADINNYCRT